MRRTKHIRPLILVVLLALLVTACGEKDPEKDKATVVAEVNGVQITKGEAQQVYDWSLAQTIARYEQEGTYIDATDKTFIAAVKRDALNLMTQNMAIEQKLESLGYGLTEEDREHVAADAQAEYDMSVQYIQYLSGATEADIPGIRTWMDDTGYSVEAWEYMLYMQMLDDSVFNYGLSEITVTEEEVEAAYGERIASARETYASDLTPYISDIVNGVTVYVHPEGVRYVKNLLVPMPDEINAKLEAKNTELYNATLELDQIQQQLDAGDLSDQEITDLEASLAEQNANIEALQSEYGTLQEQAYVDALPLAEEIYAKATAEDADFDALMDEYSTDTPPETVRETGYPVAANTTFYVQEFTTAAMALAEVGDISEPVRSQYGYHLLLYSGDVTPEEVPFAQVQDALREELLNEKKNDAMESRIAQWVEEADIKTYINRF